MVELPVVEQVPITLHSYSNARSSDNYLTNKEIGAIISTDSSSPVWDSIMNPNEMDVW